jgi:hypothetical protein
MAELRDLEKPPVLQRQQAPTKYGAIETSINVHLQDMFLGTSSKQSRETKIHLRMRFAITTT